MVITTNTMESISPYVVPGIKFEYMPKLDQEYKAEKIRDKVCQFFNIPVVQVMVNNRKLRVAIARQFSMYFIRMNTDLPLTEIGKMMGGFHHTSVMHSIAKVKSQISAKHDNSFKEYHSKLITII